MLLVAIGLFLIYLLAHALYSIYAIHHLNEYGYSGDASQYMLRLYAGFSSLVVIVALAAVIYGLAS